MMIFFSFFLLCSLSLALSLSLSLSLLLPFCFSRLLTLEVAFFFYYIIDWHSLTNYIPSSATLGSYKHRDGQKKTLFFLAAPRLRVLSSPSTYFTSYIYNANRFAKDVVKQITNSINFGKIIKLEQQMN
jgi:hypothetical protein